MIHGASNEYHLVSVLLYVDQFVLLNHRQKLLFIFHYTYLFTILKGSLLLKLASNSRMHCSHNLFIADMGEDSIREFEMLTPTTSVLQSNTEKGRGLTLQKRVRGKHH